MLTQPNMRPVTPSRSESAADEPVTVVRFRIGGVAFATPLDAVAAVLEPGTALGAEGTPGLWIGQVQSQSGAIPVASGAMLFGADTGTYPVGRLLVFRGERPLAISVDHVSGSAVIEPGLSYPLPDIAGGGERLLVENIVWDEDGGLDLVLEPRLLLADLERHRNGAEQAMIDAPASPAALQKYSAAAADRLLEIRFQDSDEAWGIPLAAIRHVAAYREPHPLPRAPRNVTGLLSWRRRPIPVISGSAWFGVERPPDGRESIVVLGDPLRPGQAVTEADCALLVDGVAGLIASSWAEGGYAVADDGRWVRLVDLSATLAPV